MNRRDFLSNSLAAAGGALLPGRGFAGDASLVPPGNAASIAPSDPPSARFPPGFLWGMATACYNVIPYIRN